MPRPSDKPLSQIDSNFQLHSDIRAEQREEYDMKRRDAEAQLDAAKREREERHRKEEELEIQRLRREAVHKAQPIRQYNPVTIHPCEKPVTEPLTPKWTYIERSKRKGNTEINKDAKETTVTCLQEADEQLSNQKMEDTFNV